MNRINKLFNEKKQNILSLYFCAGHPTAGSTADIIRTLAARGIHSTAQPMLSARSKRTEWI